MNSTSHRALVTGASSEVGLAITSRLVALGFEVHGTSRTTPDTELLARHHAGDLADPDFVDALIADIGPFQTLVHAAAHRFQYQRFHLNTVAQRQHIWALEVQSLESLAAAALPHMMTARFGRIVAIGSLAAAVGGPGATTYAAAKAGAAGLMRGIASEYGRFRITANVVAPGAIDNARLHARLADPAEIRNLSQRAAMKRLVTPAEVAGAVAFLVGPDGAAITGQTLTVAAGMDLQGAW